MQKLTVNTSSITANKSAVTETKFEYVQRWNIRIYIYKYQMPSLFMKDIVTVYWHTRMHFICYIPLHKKIPLSKWSDNTCWQVRKHCLNLTLIDKIELNAFCLKTFGWSPSITMFLWTIPWGKYLEMKLKEWRISCGLDTETHAPLKASC